MSFPFQVRIDVKDDNDNSPVFLPSNTYAFSVDTSELALGLVIGQVQARDVDSGINGLVRYRIRTSDVQDNPSAPFNFFGIDAATGHIRIKKLINGLSTVELNGLIIYCNKQN